MGTLDGNIYLGRYSGSFTGTSTWKVVPTDTLTQIIDTKKSIKLRVEYQFDKETVAVNSLNIAQGVLDKLASTLKSGDKYEIPVDFVLVTTKIGIIE